MSVATTPVLSQPEEVVEVLFFGPSADLRQMRRAALGPGAAQTWTAAGAWIPAAGVTTADLAPLRRVEQLLAAARRAVAELDEAAALRHLAEAQRLAWDALGVPGAAAFCAEVELQLAVTAAQAGRWALTEDSLGRAARLDGQRRLLAGEASPELVSLSDRVFRDAAAGAQGELPISADAQAALIFVDDVDRGLAPQRVRVRVGTHALRIEAPRRIAYHARLEVAEGTRPAQRFVLAPDPRELAKQRVGQALGADAATLADATRALLLAAPELRAVAWVESDHAAARQLLHSCDRVGCADPLRFQRGMVRKGAAPMGGGTAPLTQETLAAARKWLHARTLSDREQPLKSGPWWNRWYVWSALGALALSGGVLAALALQPAPTRTLRVVVDAGDLRGQ